MLKQIVAIAALASATAVDAQEIRTAVWQVEGWLCDRIDANGKQVGTRKDVQFGNGGDIMLLSIQGAFTASASATALADPNKPMLRQSLVTILATNYLWHGPDNTHVTYNDAVPGKENHAVDPHLIHVNIKQSWATNPVQPVNLTIPMPGVLIPNGSMTLMYSARTYGPSGDIKDTDIKECINAEGHMTVVYYQAPARPESRDSRYRQGAPSEVDR